ncbi:MAG: hypothetical protein K0R83_1523 [Caulobacter sp.]|jgi:hypothetical protein|nr:hypothetical protein [Caulobacter sp.]
MRQLIAASAAALLLAAPAAAQEPAEVAPVTDPATKVLIAMLDHCLDTMNGKADYDKGAQKKGWGRTGNGGWGKKVGKSMMATELAITNLASGSFRICAVNMAPASVDVPGLKAALAERAAAYPLTPVAPRLDKRGGTQSGFENPKGPLIGLTITEMPAKDDLPPKTFLSVIWRE